MRELCIEGNGTEASIAQYFELLSNPLGREAGSEESRHAEPCAVVREMQVVSQGHGYKENRHLLGDFHGAGAGHSFHLPYLIEL